LDIPEGDFVALMGPSGSGKTTLLNLIGGLDSPTAGSIVVDGQRIDRLASGELSRWRAAHVGFVFQSYNLLPVLSAERNVDLPLLLAALFRKKTRTVLTLASVFVAFLLFGLLHAVKVAFESGADNADAKRLLTTARYSIIEPLPLAYLGRIEAVPGVMGAAYADWFGAKYQNESNAFAVFAVDPARYLDM